MTPLLDTLDYGAPIHPTPAQLRRAYRVTGSPVPDNISDLDPARGVIQSVVIGLAAFMAFSWVLS